MATSFEERVREHAPGSAKGYYLELHHSDETISRYPPEGAFRLSPFTPPSGTPFGTYMLYFVSYLTDRFPMTTARGYVPSVRIQVPQTKKAVVDQAVRELHNAAKQTDEGQQDEHRDEREEEAAEPPLTPADRRAELDFAIATTPAMITARADYDKQRLAMDLAENNQELLSKGSFSRDAAEALALSRAYRREAQITIEAQAHLTRRTAEEVQSHWAAFRTAQEAQMEGMRLVREQLELFARPVPPPPPVDYTPAFVEGLKTLRDVSVALVQSKASVPVAPPPAPELPLPNQTTTAKVAANTVGETAGGARVRGASPASTPVSPPTSVRTPDDLDIDLLAPFSVLLGGPDAEPSVAPTVQVVAPVTPPAQPSVASVIDPAHLKDQKDEAARLWRALAETSEIEAVLATVNPEQLQAFLSRLRKRIQR